MTALDPFRVELAACRLFGDGDTEGDDDEDFDEAGRDRRCAICRGELCAICEDTWDCEHDTDERHGEGDDDAGACEDCDGDGKVRDPAPDAPGALPTTRCLTCNGGAS